MPNFKKNFLIVYLLITTQMLTAMEIPIHELKALADGLNIEGGSIPRQYLCDKQIWANLCVVLDRPFEDHVEWKELKSSSLFPLKETTIQDYNETQVNYTYATLMNYYITQAHHITNKPLEETTKVLIQVHRNSSGHYHVGLLESLLLNCYPDILKIKLPNKGRTKYELFSYTFPDINVEATFCYGTAPENLGELGLYNEFDIILCFSSVAGFHPHWKSSSLLLPTFFIPFSLKHATIYPEEKYFVNNHLITHLKEILSTQNSFILGKVNELFRSINFQKNYMTTNKLKLDDFKIAVVLQVEQIFNPSEHPTSIRIQTQNQEKIEESINGPELTHEEERIDYAYHP